MKNSGTVWLAKRYQICLLEKADYRGTLQEFWSGKAKENKEEGRSEVL